MTKLLKDKVLIACVVAFVLLIIIYVVVEIV